MAKNKYTYYYICRGCKPDKDSLLKRLSSNGTVTYYNQLKKRWATSSWSISDLVERGGQLSDFNIKRLKLKSY